MTQTPIERLKGAIDDARRGHRPSEWESVAGRLATAAEDHLNDSTRHTRSNAIAGMQAEVAEFCEAKGWRGPGVHTASFGEAMALLHSEVSEALEAYRDWKLADATAHHSPSAHSKDCAYVIDCGTAKHASELAACDCEYGKTAKPEGVGSEFADILIRLLDDCDLFGVDLAAEYERKMAYNHTRAFRHGGRAL